MTVNTAPAWHLRLANLRDQRPSRSRDIALSALVDEDFDPADEQNIEELLLSFVADVDTSVLQSFENALGKAEYRHYFFALGRCYARMSAVSPRVATERLNFPARELSEAEVKESFNEFVAGLEKLEFLELMRRTIVEWRLLGSEPYRTFFNLSQLVEGEVNG